MTDWQPDRLHPLRVQLRDRGPARRPPARADPRRQGASRHRRATPATRRCGSTTTRTARHRLTSPLRRRPDGSYEEIDWDTAIAEIAARLQRGSATSTAASRSSTTAAAARATTSAAPTAAPSCGRSASRYRSSALAQEKTGRGVGRRTALRRPHPRRVRARRGRGVRRQEPVDVAELPARARGPPRDRQGPGSGR